MAVLYAAFGSLAVVGLALQFLFLASLRRMRAQPVAASLHRPPISVLRPVCGIDEDLDSNLASLLEQDYPEFEVVVIAGAPDDPALPIVREVCRRYPRRKVHLVAGGPRLGRNPKISSLIHGLRGAENEWILISDSNVRMHPSYLARLADAAAQPGVAMVANLIAGVGAKSLGAQLENLQLSGYLLPATAAAAVVRGVPCVMGKSMFFRRGDLEAVGGFASVADYLAEDFLLARAFCASGRGVFISPDILCTVNRNWSMRRFFSRHLRWNQIRWRVSPQAYWAEGFCAPGAPCLILQGLAAYTGDGKVLCAAAALLLLRFAAAALMEREVSPARSLGVQLLPLIIVRDLLVTLIWLVSPWVRTVSWRGRRYRIGPDSYIRPLSQGKHANDGLRPEAA